MNLRKLDHPLVSSFSFYKGENITKEGVDNLALSVTQKQPLAHVTYVE